MPNTLAAGDARVGLLTDGKSEQVFGAMLTRTADRGVVRVSVPLHSSIPEHENIRGWLRPESAPTSLLFLDDAGAVILSGLRWAGHRGGSVQVVDFLADEAIFARPRVLKTEFRVTSVMSNLDALNDWVGSRSIVLDDIAPGQVVAHIEKVDDIVFRAAGFTYTIRDLAPWTATEGASFEAKSESVLITSTYRRATTTEHLQAQWPIRALLTLLCGEPFTWNRHRIRDDAFPTFMAGGPARPPDWRDAILGLTLEPSNGAATAAHKYVTPSLTLQQLGASGMRRWVDL